MWGGAHVMVLLSIVGFGIGIPLVIVGAVLATHESSSVLTAMTPSAGAPWGTP